MRVTAQQVILIIIGIFILMVFTIFFMDPSVIGLTEHHCNSTSGSTLSYLIRGYC